MSENIENFILNWCLRSIIPIVLRKKNIFVLMGGRSSEHEVSLISGREVVNNLNSSKYNIFPIVISRGGDKWMLTSKDSLKLMSDPIKNRNICKEVKLVKKEEFNSLSAIQTKPDVVFIAMHGPFGEDGTIQGMLDLIGMKYTGSGVLASALGMDKLMFRKIIERENLPVPKYMALKRKDCLLDIKKSVGKPPYFIKPNNQGSSVGASMAKNMKELNKSLKIAWKYCDTALVDEYIKGIEVTCGVLGNDKPFALPIVEIIPKKSTFFDYESKYTESGSEEIVPARISEKLSKKVQEIALRVHLLLGCRGFSRVDFIVKGNTPYILEINTIPGLTPMSLLPKAAEAQGICYSDLLDLIIKYAKE